jgi:hypothetical protein
MFRSFDFHAGKLFLMDQKVINWRCLPQLPIFLTKRFGLELFFLPYVVWALAPAVGASLENAVSALNSVKKPTFAHKQFTLTIKGKLSLLVCVFVSYNEKRTEKHACISIYRFLTEIKCMQTSFSCDFSAESRTGL